MRCLALGIGFWRYWVIFSLFRNSWRRGSYLGRFNAVFRHLSLVGQLGHFSYVHLGNLLPIRIWRDGFWLGCLRLFVGAIFRFGGLILLWHLCRFRRRPFFQLFSIGSGRKWRLHRRQHHCSGLISGSLDPIACS